MEQLFYNAELPPEVAEQVRFMPEPAATAARKQGHCRNTHQREPRQDCLPGIGDFLLSLDSEQPVVICIDDIQFADALSLRRLLYLLRRMRSRRLFVVLTEADLPQPVVSQFMAEIARLPHRMMRLSAISEGGIAQILSDFMAPGLVTKLSPRFRELSGGNPLLVKALVTDYCGGLPGGSPDDEAELVPRAAFGEAVLGCLWRWNPEIFEVALSIAILGEFSSADLISRLSGIDRVKVVQVTDILTGAGVLARERFRHPVATSAVLCGISTQERSLLHLKAAELLEASGCGALAVAKHLIAAGTAIDTRHAGILRRAEEQALADGDSATAVRCLAFALSKCPNEEEQVLTSRALLNATWHISPTLILPYRSLLERSMRYSWLDARDLVKLVRLVLWAGDFASVGVILRELRASKVLLSPDVLAELRLTLHWFYGPAYRKLWQAIGTLADDDSPEEAPPDSWLHGVASLTTVWTQGVDESSLASAESVLRSFRPEAMCPEVALTALQALAIGDKADGAAAWCDDMITEASRRGATMWHAMLGVARAEISLRTADPEAAIASVQNAFSIVPAEHWGALTGYPLSILLQAHTARGCLDAAASIVERKLPDAMFGTVMGMRYLHARGHYYLAKGRARAALTDFEACRDLARNKGLDVPALVPLAGDLAEVNLQLGNNGLAYEFATRQLERPESSDGRTLGAALYVLAASGEQSQRSLLLTKSIDYLRAAGDQVALARAQALLEETRRRAVPGGSVIDIPAQDRPGLSKAELRVAELASQGHTNREIGQELWVTVSTVEQHLTRVYRKLGVKGRVDLAASLVSSAGDTR